jgi:ketosteroid isomerase-like protein
VRDRAAWLATRDDQDYEVVTDRYWPEADAVRGREAAWEFYVKVAEAFERLPVTDVELVDAGPTRFLSISGATCADGQAGQRANSTTVITFREGRIVRDHWFADRAEALEAAVLRE